MYKRQEKDNRPSLNQYYGVTNDEHRQDKDGTIIRINNYLKDIREELLEDSKLRNIIKRVQEGDEIINRFYCIHDDTLFIRNTPQQESWKLVIPPAIERPLIIDYHDRYGHCLLYTSRCV